MEKTKLNIIGMTCASCVNHVDKALRNTQGVLDVSVNLTTETATITYEDSSFNQEQALHAVRDAGYDAVIENEEIKSATLRVEGMTCASCASRVEQAVIKLNGIKFANVNIANDKINISFDSTMLKISQIKKAVQDVGYDLILEEELDEEIDPTAQKMNKAKKTMIQSMSITITMMTLMIVHMFIIKIPFYTWIVAFMAIPVIFIFGFHVHKGSFKTIKAKSPNMDVLVSLGSIPPYLIGLLGLFMPITTFVEMATTIMTFHLLGKYLEARAKGKASQAIKKLMDLGAKTARIIVDGTEIQVLTSELSVGDLMIVKPGEKIPTDGIIVWGESLIDESLATGESMPVQKGVGDQVIGATINKQGLLKVEVKKVGNETFLAQVIEMVEACQGSKVPIQEYADRITSYFVPGILVITLLTFVSFLVFTPFHLNILRFMEPILPWINTSQSPLTLAFITATAVLVIACPCALGLGTPTALMVGSGIGAEKGILIRNGEAVQTLKDVSVIAFDKTGTLTYGKPVVTDMFSKTLESNHFLALLASIEKSSEHPLASAIVEHAHQLNLTLSDVESFEAVTGKGVIGVIESQRYYVGNRKLMDDQNLSYLDWESKMVELEDQAKTVMIFANDLEVLGIIAVADAIKPQARSVIAQIEAMGISTAMITGDNARTAKAIALSAGISHVISDVLPEGKVKEIKNLQDAYGLVAMVGDGINDAPALKQANIGIAIGTGTDVAIEASDVTLVRGDLNSIVSAILLSKAIFRKIKENYFWAWFYNALAIPFAMLGLLHPMIGAAAMSLSSLNVIYNSLRLKKINLS